MDTSFPVEFPNGPSNTIASLPETASQSGYDKLQFESTGHGFSIGGRRTLMQRTRSSHSRLLNMESVPQNVPDRNPQASLRAAWEHTNTIIPGAGNPQSWDRFAYSINNPVNYTDPSGHCFVPATGQEFPYGGPGPCPAQMTVSGWDPSYGEKQDTNECATTSLAAGMSVVLGQKISKNDVTSKFRAMGRKWFKIGVPPKVQANGVNALNMGVKATFSQGTTRQDLIDGVLADKVIVPTVSWSKLKYYGHTVVVIGYRFNDDELIFFDPGTGEKVTESKWNEKWDDFEQSWLQQPRWFIPPGSMVTLELSQSSAPQNSQGTGCSGSCNSSVAQ